MNFRELKTKANRPNTFDTLFITGLLYQKNETTKTRFYCQTMDGILVHQSKQDERWGNEDAEVLKHN